MTRASVWLEKEIMREAERTSASPSADSQFLLLLSYCFTSPRNRATVFGCGDCALHSCRELQSLCEWCPLDSWQPLAGAWSPCAISEFGLLSPNEDCFLSLC